MWNTVVSNRLLNRRQKQEAYMRHLKALKNLKSSINNHPPKSYSFLDSRPKAKQLELDREIEISHENTLLINKMMAFSKTTSCHSPLKKKSLHSAYKRKRDRQIDISNQILIRKLQKASSVYSQDKLAPSVRQYQRDKSNMALSRVDPYFGLPANNDTNVCKYETNTNQKRRRPYTAKR